MGPQNYILRGMADPGLAFSQGLQDGQQQVVQQQAQALALQQQRAAMEAAARREAVIQEIVSAPRPTAAQYAKLMTLMPEKAEGFNKAWAALNTEQSQSRLSDLTQWTAAIEAGRPEVAVNAMIAQADALDAQAGKQTPEGQALRAQADIVKADPRLAARVVLGPLLAAHPDGGKVLDNITKRAAEERASAMFPAELRTKEADAVKAEADAVTAGVTAKYAERGALLELEQKGWNIEALKADVAYKREASRIAAISAQINREGNDLKRQELQLKVDEARAKLDSAAREKVAEFDQRISGVTDARTLIREIKELRDTAWVNPTGITATAGYMPGTNARTQMGKIDQLKNVLSLEYLDKLKGPTSDRDIAFLKAIAANLDTMQSDSRFAGELDKVDAALARVDAAVRKKYGAPPAPRPSNPAPGAAASTGGVTVSGW